MDRHVRWFRREVAVGVAQRLAVESVCVGTLVAGSALAGGGDPFASVTITLLAIPVFIAIRIGLGLLANPLPSTYLIRRPRPSGSIAMCAPTSGGSPIDLALQAAGFAVRGSFTEWGGTTSNLYASEIEDSLALVGPDDDLLVISGLRDGRLCVSTTKLVPPHERLIVNYRPRVRVEDLLASHSGQLADLLSEHHLDHILADIRFVVELLAIEWEAWDEIGPLLGPFIAIEGRFQPTLLLVRVSGDDMRSRALAGARTEPTVSTAAPDMSTLREQALHAAERTNRAIAAGGAVVSTSKGAG